MWKIIKEYDKYEANEEGLIRNKRTKRILRPETCKGGYLRVRLYKNEKFAKHELVHRIVANTFLENKNNLPEVNHKDNNPKNNNVSNLEFCTAQYNSRYSKSKAVMIVYPSKYGKTFSCIREAESKTGVNNSSISRCCKGKQKYAGGFIWRYVEATDTNWASKKEVNL